MAEAPESDPVTIRRAVAGDAATIARLVKRLAESTGHVHKVTSDADDFLRHGFGERPAFYGFLAEQDGRACGMSLWFYQFSSWRGRPGAYLQDLYVDEALRGSGLGRRLLAYTAEAALKDGADHMRLSVATDNDGARAFYDRLGFTYRDDECIYQVAGAPLDALAAATKDAD